MIMAERKPIEEIVALIGDKKKVMVLGCGGCVTICFAGGEKEAAILTEQLKLIYKEKNEEKEFIQQTIERQCDHEFFEKAEANIKSADVVISIACGVGVQFCAEKYSPKDVFPGLNTKFMGGTESPGYWVERCQGCGNCVLALTGGICPVARCSKSLLNGPCGGSSNGKCEVGKEIDCAWDKIHKILKEKNKLQMLDEIIPMKDWSTSRDGGFRVIKREDLFK